MEENETKNLSETAVSSAEMPAPGVQSIENDKVQTLEIENRKMQTEFNMQRAKLKDLFMQKEADYNKCQAEKQALERELNELKSQFVVADIKSENEMHLKDQKAQEEISSLQQLVQDTIEESTICKAELEHMKEENIRLRLETKELREGWQHQQQEATSLGPQVFNQVKKTIRKLGGDSSAALMGSSLNQESFDESSKKIGNKYAHEDAEVLRSIVVQLQEERNALKDKLRDADDKLQTNNSVPVSVGSTETKLEFKDLDRICGTSMEKSTSMDHVECSTCVSYEAKVKAILEKQTGDEEKIENLEKCLEETREDLKKEAALRKDLEDQWQEKREAHKTEVQLLREQVKRNEKELLDLQQKFLETKEDVIKKLQRVTDERERVNKHLETLQADNDFLCGRYLATAEEIENQYINLPNTVEELQVLMLRQQSELIQARVGSEFEKQKCVTSLDEIKILREQLDDCNNERRNYKRKTQTEMTSLQNRLRDHLLTLQSYETSKTALERKEAELNKQISELRVEVIELQENIEKVNNFNADYKAKIKILQEDLSTSEQVQKDFVKLSQTLQMSLEELRNADTEVRWQDDDDVDKCPTCNTSFTVTVRKLHCRHCGHIYCDKCLSKTVPSGPRKRSARVCDICHTLLTPNTAPYFSHEPVQSS